MSHGKKSAGIVGLGLIGSSAGLALRAEGWNVVGLDTLPGRPAQAVAGDAVDSVVASVAELARQAPDLVILATPPGAVVPIAEDLVRRGATAITDTASAKGRIVEALGWAPSFLGSHPMAGGDLSIEGARADLFQGAVWVLTPGAGTSVDTRAIVLAAVSAVGAVPVETDAETHDRIVARTSHVPHVLAAALVRMVAATDDRAGLLAGRGLVDMTRLANGSAELWVDILRANRQQLIAPLEQVQTEIGRVIDAVSRGEWSILKKWLDDASRARPALLLAAEGGAHSGVVGAHV